MFIYLLGILPGIITFVKSLKNHRQKALHMQSTNGDAVKPNKKSIPLLSVSK